MAWLARSNVAALNRGYCTQELFHVGLLRNVLPIFESQDIVYFVILMGRIIHFQYSQRIRS